MSWTVEFSPRAKQDLQRLYDFLIEHDRLAARKALTELARALEMLQTFPRSCRRAGGSSRTDLRELLVPFGHAGYVVLFRLQPPGRVQVIGVRHQREDDF